VKSEVKNTSLFLSEKPAGKFTAISEEYIAKIDRK